MSSMLSIMSSSPQSNNKNIYQSPKTLLNAPNSSINSFMSNFNAS